MFPRAVRKPESHKRRRNEVGSESQKEQVDKRKASESKLTFDLLLLPLEGLARLLSLALQVEDRGLLLLKGLAQILVRDADLNQLTVEPRHLLLSLLERGPRPLERGALPLELAQCCTPATGLATLGPRRGRPGPRTAPGTSEGQRRGGRGRRIAPGPDAPAPAANEQGKKGGRQEKHERKESRRRNCETPRNPTNLEDAPRRTTVDPQCLVHAQLSEAS
jgi:hypothetical protein